jgi:hypothetical protein
LVAIPRKNLKNTIIILLLLTNSILGISCDCPETSLKTQWESHRLIFQGTLIESRDIKHNGIYGNTYNLLEFKIQRIFKSKAFEVGDTISILNIEDFPCGFHPFELNSEYIIFASPGRVIQVSQCSGTFDLNDLNNGIHLKYNSVFDSLEYYKSNYNDLNPDIKKKPPIINSNKGNILNENSFLRIEFDIGLWTLLIISIILNILLIVKKIKKKK